ncbi:MAG: hypothetical protein MEQ07_11910 [Aquimonas sp.]|nr:hypothetical protein [Aquimonas sp.]
MRHALCLALLALLPLTSAEAATTYTVTSTADSGPGSLRAAIQTLGNNTGENIFTIAFDVGSNQTIAVASDLPVIGRSGAIITIDGAGSPGLQIDGLGTSRLLYSFRNALFTVRDLALVRGRQSGGGCLRNGASSEDGSPMVVTRVLFSGCIGGIEGGGAILTRNQLNVSDSVFLDNRIELPPNFSAGGGAIAKLGSTGNLIIESSTFIGNSALGVGGINSNPQGGAIYIDDNRLNHLIQGSWLTGNAAFNPSQPSAGYGGAVHLETGALQVERSFLRGNRAGLEGGAIAVASRANASATRRLILRNLSFEANTSTMGAAVAFGNYGNQNGVLDVRNSLFQFNEAASIESHGIFMMVGAGTLNLSHNAFGAQGLNGSSAGAHCMGAASSQNANAVLAGSSVGCGAAAITVSTLGLIGSEPSLPAARPVAYALAPNSPLIDAGVTGAGNIGNPAACLTSDARGVLRPQVGVYGGGVARCDVGPVETIAPMFRDGFES